MWVYHALCLPQGVQETGPDAAGVAAASPGNTEISLGSFFSADSVTGAKKRNIDVCEAAAAINEVDFVAVETQDGVCHVSACRFVLAKCVHLVAQLPDQARIEITGHLDAQDSA
jgi:hypothetical protein